MTEYFPCALNLSGRDCVVIGSDDDAASKAARLSRAGATVRTFDAIPAFGDIGEPFLLIFSDKGNKKGAQSLFAYCEKRKILMCAIDQPEFCHFVNVSVFKAGALLISVSTGGVSPAAARKIRQGLEASLQDEPLDRFFADLAALRSSLTTVNIDSTEKRKKLIEAVEGFEFEARIKFPAGWREKTKNGT